MSVDSLSNEEIRDELMRLGHNIGPITPSTRKVYLNKLKKGAQNGGQALNFDNSSSEDSFVQKSLHTNGSTSFIEKSFPANGFVDASGDHAVTEESNDDSSIAYPKLNDAVNSFLGEPDNDDDDHQESMRLLTPEEVKNRRKYMPPMARRRSSNKSKQFFLAYVCLFAIGCLLAFLFAKVVIFPIFEQKAAVKQEL